MPARQNSTRLPCCAASESSNNKVNIAEVHLVVGGGGESRGDVVAGDSLAEDLLSHKNQMVLALDSQKKDTCFVSASIMQ